MPHACLLPHLLLHFVLDTCVLLLLSTTCLQAIRAADSVHKLHVEGIATFCEMAVPLVSRLAEALGLPGNTPAAVDAARDKVGGGAGRCEKAM